VKQACVTATCALALVASLSACGGAGAGKSALPIQTGGSSPSATATNQPTKARPAAGGTGSGQAALAAHTTYTYDGLKVVVNLPPDIPNRARPGVRLFSDFLQGVGRTTAKNKLDPYLTAIASVDAVRYVETFVEAGSAKGAGSVTFTINKVQSSSSGGFGVITGCLDQSELVQVRKNGARYVDANATKYPTLKMTADVVAAGQREPQVSRFAYAVGACS
jgi:hypothetical protein